MYTGSVSLGRDNSLVNEPLFWLQAEIEVVEQYSDPRDSKSKAYVEPGAETSLPTIYSKANRNYCRPYTGKSQP